MTRSATRLEVDQHVKEFADIVREEKSGGQLAYIGVAGDPTTKGEYHTLFPNFVTTSFDADSRWHADVTMDITSPSTEHYHKYDVLVMTQVIEHIPNLWDVPHGINLMLNDNGMGIVDCPWNYPYHAEPPSFGDYWRITKDGFMVLFQDFEIIKIIEGDHNISCLFRARR